MEMFGNAVVDPARNTTAFLTSQHANFGDFSKSVVLLFQISTENNWNEVGSLINEMCTKEFVQFTNSRTHFLFFII